MTTYLATRRNARKRTWNWSLASFSRTSMICLRCGLWKCGMFWTGNRSVCYISWYIGYENRRSILKNRDRAQLRLSMVWVQEPSRMVYPLYYVWSLRAQRKIPFRWRTACLEGASPARVTLMWFFFQKSKPRTVSRISHRGCRTQVTPPQRSLFLRETCQFPHVWWISYMAGPDWARPARTKGNRGYLWHKTGARGKNYWSIVVFNPRVIVDKLPRNQCLSTTLFILYLWGRTSCLTDVSCRQNCSKLFFLANVKN